MTVKNVRAHTLGAIGVRQDSGFAPKGKFSCIRCGMPIGRPRDYTDTSPTVALCRDCNSLHDPLIKAWRES